jgi:uncharacterized protein
LLNLPSAERDELDKNEDAFVVARRRCAGNRGCIEQSYRERIQELQATLLERDPDARAAMPLSASDQQKAGRK